MNRVPEMLKAESRNVQSKIATTVKKQSEVNKCKQQKKSDLGMYMLNSWGFFFP